VKKPSKGSIRNLQEEIVYGDIDASKDESENDDSEEDSDPTIIFQ
jgi:hypothetical protein